MSYGTFETRPRAPACKQIRETKSAAYESLALFDLLGVPNADLARRIIRLLNLPTVVERRLAATDERRST